MKTLIMNNGLPIPIIGSGTNTFGKEGNVYMGAINNDTTEIENAMSLGYTLWDTAISYRNESVLGLAIKRSGIDRKKLFITSKIPGQPEYTKTDELVEASVVSSLKALDTDYIDLYLIHRPWEDLQDNVRVWKVLEKQVDLGRIKTLGVSNFNNIQLDYLLKHSRIRPAVNQIESHPGFWEDDLIEFCQKNGVIPQAWGPITRVSDEAKAVLTKIGERYGKTWVQVVLRYQIERDVVVIPKSKDKVRQTQNLNVFDFSLNEADKALIKNL
jgi:diketogulonate reductase-like aldo/keto reductase